MRRIAVSNQKGGSGKTTSTVNLAAALAERGRSVLVVDLDPQGNASSWLGTVSEERGLLDVFSGESGLEELVEETRTVGVDLVPASAWLATVERSVAGEVGAELVFRGALDRLPKRWDFVLVDTPPTLGLLVVATLAAVSEVLVPVEASVLGLQGVASLLGTLAKVRERLNPELGEPLFLPVRVDGRTNLSGEVVESLRKNFEDRVFDVVVRESVRVREAPSHGVSVLAYDPKGAGAVDYREVARELEERGAR